MVNNQSNEKRQLFKQISKLNMMRETIYANKRFFWTG